MKGSTTVHAHGNPAGVQGPGLHTLHGKWRSPSTQLCSWRSGHICQASLASCAGITRNCFGAGPNLYMNYHFLRKVYLGGHGLNLGSADLMSLLIPLIFIFKLSLSVCMGHEKEARILCSLLMVFTMTEAETGTGHPSARHQCHCPHMGTYPRTSHKWMMYIWGRRMRSDKHHSPGPPPEQHSLLFMNTRKQYSLESCDFHFQPHPTCQ